MQKDSGEDAPVVLAVLHAMLSDQITYAEKPQERNSGKFFADMGEKCGEKMAKFFADFRSSIFRKSGRKKFHEKLATNSAGREIKFFHRETLGVWGHKITSKEAQILVCGRFANLRHTRGHKTIQISEESLSDSESFHLSIRARVFR